MRVGLDIGSTTIKCVVLNDAGEIVFSTYERHFSHILEKGRALLEKVAAEYLPDGKAYLAISGSAGMGLADSCKVPFVQEVFATRVAANRLVPGTDCIIELGGEDAKILFLTERHGGAHERQLRRRHRCLHRPDGHPAEDGRGRDGPSGPAGYPHLHHRQPLRRVCQKRHPAVASTRAHRPVTSRRQHLSGGGQPDHRGPGPGPPDSGQRPVPGRAADLLQDAAPELRQDPGRYRHPVRRTACFLWRMGAAFYADEVLDLHEVAERLDNYSATATYVQPAAAVCAISRSTRSSTPATCKASVPLPALRRGLRAGAYRHRLWLHHHQAGGHRPKRQHPV